MSRSALVKFCVAGSGTFMAAWILPGQPPPQDQPPAATRDNFHAKASKLPRLSPEELDKKIAADFAKESKSESKAEAKAKQTKQDKTAKGKAPPDAAAAGAAVPAHRLSLDVLATHPAAKKQAHKEFQITLKNWFIEKYK